MGVRRLLNSPLQTDRKKRRLSVGVRRRGLSVYGYRSADERCRSGPALENVERYGDESGFGCQLVVCAHGFAARAHFSFERDVFDIFRAAVEEMDRSLQGSARLQPRYEDGFVELTMGPAGSVFVSGEVVRAAEFSQRLFSSSAPIKLACVRSRGTLMHAQS